MKGVILAGGTGSRLHPLTKAVNKHMLPVGDKIMLEHPILKLTEAGIRDIVIVVGKEHAGLLMDHLGSGKDYSCKFTYKIQDEAGGIAQALYLCKEFVGQEDCCVILGDNMFQDKLDEFIKDFQFHKTTTGRKHMVILKQVPDAHRFGVASLENGELTEIIEKPTEPKTNLAVTGIYFYSPEVFDAIATLKPSKRKELEITEANDFFIKQRTMAYSEFKGWWSDSGTHPSYIRANELVRGIRNE